MGLQEAKAEFEKSLQRCPPQMLDAVKECPQYLIYDFKEKDNSPVYRASILHYMSDKENNFTGYRLLISNAYAGNEDKGCEGNWGLPPGPPIIANSGQLTALSEEETTQMVESANAMWDAEKEQKQSDFDEAIKKDPEVLDRVRSRLDEAIAKNKAPDGDPED